MFINRGTIEGEKLMKEECLPCDINTTKKHPGKAQSTKSDQKDNNIFNVKVKHAQSIQHTMGERDEAVHDYLKRTRNEWDAWNLTEIWRNEVSENIGIEDESESEEEVANTTSAQTGGKTSCQMETSPNISPTPQKPFIKDVSRRITIRVFLTKVAVRQTAFLCMWRSREG